MEKEFWRDVVGYEGLYQISNWGRVKSLERIDCRGQLLKERILKPWKCRGYLRVDLCKNGKGKSHLVHRLVAQAFIPNDDPERKTQVNHINEDKTDNRVKNLEWCDHKYNNNFGTRNERASKAKTNGKRSKRVVGINPGTGEEVHVFPSASEAGRNGYNQSAVSACCRKDKGHKTYKGLIWRYKEVS